MLTEADTKEHASTYNHNISRTPFFISADNPTSCSRRTPMRAKMWTFMSAWRIPASHTKQSVQNCTTWRSGHTKLSVLNCTTWRSGHTECTKLHYLEVRSYKAECTKLHYLVVRSYKAECTKLHYLEVRSYRAYKTALPGGQVIQSRVYKTALPGGQVIQSRVYKTALPGGQVIQSVQNCTTWRSGHTKQSVQHCTMLKSCKAKCTKLHYLEGVQSRVYKTALSGSRTKQCTKLHYLQVVQCRVYKRALPASRTKEIVQSCTIWKAYNAVYKTALPASRTECTKLHQLAIIWAFHVWTTTGFASQQTRTKDTALSVQTRLKTNARCSSYARCALSWETSSPYLCTAIHRRKNGIADYACSDSDEDTLLNMSRFIVFALTLRESLTEWRATVWVRMDTLNVYVYLLSLTHVAKNVSFGILVLITNSQPLCNGQPAYRQIKTWPPPPPPVMSLLVFFLIYILCTEKWWVYPPAPPREGNDLNESINLSYPLPPPPGPPLPLVAL